MPHPTERITLLSFRTFGDYILKAPFLFELRKRSPDASIAILTNKKGAQVYPLLDSRLEVIAFDREDAGLRGLLRLARIPRSDLVYALDDSRTTLLLALLLRGGRKTGWVQGISRLFAEGGYFEWKSVRPWVSALARLALHPGRIRLPEEKYEGDVELELLDLPGEGRRLAEYRSSFARPPAPPPARPYIYCAAEAGWKARQLSEGQWTGIISALLREFPAHAILVHGAPAVVAKFTAEGRVEEFRRGSIPELFDAISGANLVVAPDSFALHLASLYDRPAIGYFGPAHPHRFRPTAPGSSSLFRQPECSPCLQLRGEAPCRRGLTQCASLAAMQPEDFVAAAIQALKA